jgi:hypothetical protein
MLQRISVVCAVLVLGLAGCFMIQGHAEMVKRDQSGGVLALQGDHDKAMEDAKKQMASNCPSGYQITGEENVKVGEKTEGNEDTQFEKHGNEKSTESTTSEVKEHRITYACNGVAPASSGSEVPEPGGETSGN